MKGKPSLSPATPGSQGFIFPCLRQTSESEDNGLCNVSCLSVSFKASLITPWLPEGWQQTYIKRCTVVKESSRVKGTKGLTISLFSFQIEVPKVGGLFKVF